jgi:hypothetical protein
MSDFFNEVVGEAKPFIQAPPGHYLARVTNAKKVKANSGNVGIELNFVLLENLDGQDMTDVDLGKCRASRTLWTDPASRDMTLQRMRTINPDVVGKTVDDAIELMGGNEVVIAVEHITTNRSTGEPLNIPRLDPKKFWSLDYYNEKVAA